MCQQRELMKRRGPGGRRRCYPLRVLDAMFRWGHAHVMSRSWGLG